MGVEEGDVLYLSRPDGIEDKEPKLIPELNGTRNQKYQMAEPESPLNEGEWLMPDGSQMTPDVIQRFKDRGMSAEQATEMMKRFGSGGQRGGQRPAGGAPREGAARSGQPTR